MIRELLKPYTDKDGFVHDRKTFGDNNRVLRTGQAFLQIWKHGELKPTDKLEYDRLTRLIELPDYSGVINRHPPRTPHKDQQGHDDYIHWLTAGMVVGSKFPERVLKHGLENWWVFNNVAPGTWGEIDENGDSHFNKSAFFFKHLATIAHFYICAKQMPPNFLRAALIFELHTTGRLDRENQDARTHPWAFGLAWELSALRNGLIDQAVRANRKRLRRDYPGGMKEVQKNHLFDKNHPFAEVWID